MESYEQKYKAALEWMRDVYPTLTGASKEDAEHFFPELTESEDERIRKGLVNFLQSPFIKETLIDEKVAPWIAYLEKQKENPKSADSTLSDCMADAKCEDRWHKVSDSLPDNGRLVLANDCLGNILLARYDGEGDWEVSVYDNEDYYCRNTITKWCDIPSEKQKESLHIEKTCKENGDSFTDDIDNERDQVEGPSRDQVDELEKAAKENAKAIKTNWIKAICIENFISGANWQKEQLRDLCYQCEKNYDNVFFKGEQNAIKRMEKEHKKTIELAEDHAMLAGMVKAEEQMKKDAIETTIVNDWTYGKDTDHAIIPAIHQRIEGVKVGDKVKIYIFKKNTL